jgi:hypothetical protein
MDTESDPDRARADVVVSPPRVPGLIAGRALSELVVSSK